MSLLSQLSCSPLKSNEPAASDGEIAALHPFVPAWKMVREEGKRKLRHMFVFDDEEMTEGFLRHLEQIAENENHHPVSDRNGRVVQVDWWTHTLSDLHPNDFIMAAKTEGAFSSALVGACGDSEIDIPLPFLHEVPRFREVVGWRQEFEKV